MGIVTIKTVKELWINWDCSSWYIEGVVIGEKNSDLRSRR